MRLPCRRANFGKGVERELSLKQVGLREGVLKKSVMGGVVVSKCLESYCLLSDGKMRVRW